MDSEIIANDLRRYAIHTRTEITYRVRSHGQVCVVNTKGIIKIPGIGGLPAYDADHVLARADEFELQRGQEKPRLLSREEMADVLKSVAGKPGAGEKED